VQVGHLLRPKIEDLAHPWGDVAHNAEVVYKGVEVSALCLKIEWVGQFAKVGVLGIFKKSFCKVFNRWIREIGASG
jgi:hypothetical protein